LSENTKRTYLDFSRAFINAVISKKGIENVSIEDIEQFASSYKSTSAGTMKSIAFLTIAVTDDYIYSNINSILKQISVDKNKYTVIGLYYFARKIGIGHNLKILSSSTPREMQTSISIKKASANSS